MQMEEAIESKKRKSDDFCSPSNPPWKKNKNSNSFDTVKENTFLNSDFSFHQIPSNFQVLLNNSLLVDYYRRNQHE